MNPLTIGLLLAGGLGGFLGGKGRKPIDPALLARLFGPDALAGDTQKLYGTLAASPAFAAIMNSASASGELAGQRTRMNLARAGLGTTSGIGTLTSAVSRGFGQNLILNARGNLWNTALESARQSLAQRLGIYGQSALQYQQTPTLAQSFGQALTGGASMGLSALLAPKTPAETQTAAPAPTTSVISAPMRRLSPTQRFAPGTQYQPN